jgi:lipopolysaccharide/colanic/teichoic acid biosynthesis glycosyltransferase
VLDPTSVNHRTRPSGPPLSAPRLYPAGTVPRWKRWSDCAIAAPLLVLTAPIVLVAIAVVKLTSAGPGIYTQTRLGLNRRPFTIYKIRTMANNCEAGTGARWSTGKSDSRVTLVGRFLRASHVDELPQLWNVLRGDMTLVGPRPERPEIVAKIEPLVPGYGERLTVLPGVTGLAQIQLPPDTNVESVRRKVRYDAYYAAHQSLWLDLRLIVVTAVKVFGIVGVMRVLLRVPGPDRVEPPRPAPGTVILAQLPVPVEPPAQGSPEHDLSRA